VRARAAATAGARVISVVAVLALVAIVLWRGCGPPWPEPLGRTDSHRLVAIALHPPDAADWRALLTAAAWLAWAWLAASLMLELAASIGTALAYPPRCGAKRDRDSKRRPPGRLVSAWMLAPAALLLATTSTRRSLPAPGPSRAPVGAVTSVVRTPGIEAATGVGSLPHRTRPATGRVTSAQLLSDHSVAPRGGPGGRPGDASGGAGGGRVLGWLGGALAATVVEEVRRVAERRRRRRLRALRRETLSPELMPIESANEADAPEALRSEPGCEGEAARVGCTVEVRILGAVVIAGAPGPFDRPKVVESIAYLALHRAGVAKSVWATALWPDRRMSPNSLNTALWQARRALGVDAAGARHLVPARAALLVLGPGVSTDLDRFELLASCGSVDGLRQALALVRGRPLDGIGDPDWVVLEGHASRLEEAAASAGLALGELALASGDPSLAAWGARQAIRASPSDERLYRLLMRCSHAAGNAGGVCSAYAELCRVLGTDPSAEDGVSPDTQVLRDELLGRSGGRRGLDLRAC